MKLHHGQNQSENFKRGAIILSFYYSLKVFDVLALWAKKKIQGLQPRIYYFYG